VKLDDGDNVVPRIMYRIIILIRIVESPWNLQKTVKRYPAQTNKTHEYIKLHGKLGFI